MASNPARFLCERREQIPNAARPNGVVADIKQSEASSRIIMMFRQAEMMYFALQKMMYQQFLLK